MTAPKRIQRRRELRAAAQARVVESGGVADGPTPPEVGEMRQAQFATSAWRGDSDAPVVEVGEPVREVSE